MSSSFCPSLGVYAAIRMDPIAMVTHLDARAAQEAQEIRPKTYLILTAFGLTLPFPGRKWYVYNVRPIGPSLRAVDEKRGFEPDMCVPIFPNEMHPSSRASVLPDGVFPYDNCYHWAGMDLDVRVLAREEGFDNTLAVELSVEKQMDMDTLLAPDMGRAKRTRLARGQALSTPLPDHSAPSLSATEKEVRTSSEDVDIFEPPEDLEDPEYIPLMHLWLDLPADLKQEDIGDPVDLYKERFAIANVIRRAHERNPDLPTLKEHIALQQDPYIGDSDSDSLSYMSRTDSEYYRSEPYASKAEDDYVDKQKRFRPEKIIRKLRESVRAALCFPIF